MSKVVRGCASAFSVLTLLVLSSASAYGQGGTTSTLSGIAVDSSGAILPGADVTATMPSTGITQSAVTNAEGAFSFPGLNVGTYTVTVKLSGFKTFVSNNVVLTSGAGASVRATLEIGGIEEQVIVSSASEIVQTQSTTISSTINSSQITKLPLTSRSAMDFVNFLPGVATPAGNRDATINGLPRGTINITLDGVNVQDNTLRSTDGFFAIVSPRLDAIEEVTVTTANQGADVGQGAVQIKFVTRSGTNKFNGSGYWYYRNDDLNANTWFNNRGGTAKANLLQNQAGVRTGGPIVIPGLFDGRNKAFFFVNYEELRQPGDTTRDRTVLKPSAIAGNFTYTGGGATQTVNVLELAARNGQLATPDPTIGKILQEINGVVSGGSLLDIDANLQRFTFNVPVETMRRYPTFRLDYNLSTKHRASFSYNYQKFTDFPDTLNNRDPSFPGFPVAAGQSSIRLGWAGSVRSTLTSSMVNEARVGYSGAPVTFFGEMNVGMFSGSAVNQQGFSLRFPTINTALTSPGNTPAPQSRNANSLLIEDTLTWLRGSHNISMGGSFTQYDIWSLNSNMVPQVTFNDIVPSDPASTTMFTSANFPGASNPNLQAAQRLFNLLTGRISTIVGDARLDDATGEYVYMGTGRQSGRLRETGIFVQDSWRLRPNLTINAGLRYDVQLPFYPLNSLYSVADINNICGRSGAASDNSCNLFQAGVMPGVSPTFSQYTEGTRAYNVDYNNFSPTIGAAWTPAQKTGLLGSLMGREGDFVIRGGYARAFSRPGLNDFTGLFNSNPGIQITVNREDGLGNLAPLPLLLRDQARLGPPAFPSTPVYPMKDIVTEDIRGFDPNIQVPYADSWSIGVQRGVGKNMAVEIRYVGTRGKEQWRTFSGGSGNEIGTLNYNEFNIFENNFLNEFRQAQRNLQANIAALRGNTFAFTGAPGTAPLPTFLGFFNGQNASQASNSAVYTGGNWTNPAFLNFLAARNPNPFGFANTNATGLMGSAALRANAAAAGIPANYFIANPDLIGGAIVSTNIGETKYDSLQLELRRRYAQGVQFQTSYVFGHGFGSDWETFRRPQFFLRDAGTPGDVTHQFKMNIVYDLPFGRGRRFGANANVVLDRIISGWQAGLNARVQSGRLVDLGNIRLSGMTVDDVQGMFKLRFDNDGKKVWMLPQDVIDNTILAYSVSPTTASGYTGATPTGRYFMPANGPDCIEVDNGAEYGECASRSLVVTGPMFKQFDLRVSKQTRLVGNINFEFAAEMLNAFNQANFVPVGGIGSTLANYEVTTLTGTNTSRVIQLVTRFNW
jgi:Carboxypeptidase regulatory-like domain/TonB dependent receptor/TonB-dependent Receptor Plug Domain